MGVIINDFSIDGQFADIDEFCDNILDKTIPALNILKDVDIKVLKSYNTYDLNVTKDDKLIDIMKVRGKPEITKLKSQLNEVLFDEPYWETDIKSNTGSIYECEFTDELEAYCLAEALERKFPVISFEHEKFKNDRISIKRDDVEENILNIYDCQNALDTLKDIGKISSFNYLCKKYGLKDSFGLGIGKNLFQDLVKDASLDSNDIDNIINDIMIFIDSEKEGIHISRYSDNIEGDLNEFRTSLSNKREIRIFYFKRGQDIVFLNGFLKKTRKTPESEKNIAIKLLDKLDKK